MEDREIYIHIPFCVKKCDYCDFLSFTSDDATKRTYVDALKREIRADFDRSVKICSVFIGGGTPSILDGDMIKEILDTVREGFELTPDCEITIECNPGTLDQNKAKIYKACGINRISLGLQACDVLVLKSIGRIHTFADFLKSYELVRELGFDNINVDLMSALPGQDLDAYLAGLKKVISLEPEHISAYSLILEDGTKMGDHIENYKKLPDEEEERQMYHKTIELMREYGYDRYEISNYCKPGYECRHNIGYWTMREYYGFGLGASGFIGGKRSKNTDSMEAYLKGELKKWEQETREDLMEEFVFLGLRMCKGISLSKFKAFFGQDCDKIYKDVIDKHIAGGLLEKKGDRLALTEKGMDLSNLVMSDFIITV